MMSLGLGEISPLNDLHKHKYPDIQFYYRTIIEKCKEYVCTILL